MQNTKNIYTPRMVQRGNSTPNEAKTQRSTIDHSTNLSIPALSPFEQLEARLNSWYEVKETHQQQRLAETQASPDQQYLYTTEENGYRYVYQVSIKLVSTVEMQPSLVDPLELDNLDNNIDTGLNDENGNALELHELADLESEVCAYEC